MRRNNCGGRRNGAAMGRGRNVLANPADVVVRVIEHRMFEHRRKASAFFDPAWYRIFTATSDCGLSRARQALP